LVSRTQHRIVVAYRAVTSVGGVTTAGTGRGDIGEDCDDNYLRVEVMRVETMWVEMEGRGDEGKNDEGRNGG